MSNNPAAPERNLHHTIPNRDDEDWDIWDTCKHGNYPGEGDCGCTMPGMLEYLKSKGMTNVD